MANGKSTGLEMNRDNLAERIAIGAMGLAITSGVVALGAAMMTDEKTQGRLAENARSMVGNLRKFVMTISEEGRETYKALQDASNARD